MYDERKEPGPYTRIPAIEQPTTQHQATAHQMGNEMMNFSPLQQFEMLKQIVQRGKESMMGRIQVLQQESEERYKEIEHIKQLLDKL